MCNFRGLLKKDKCFALFLTTPLKGYDMKTLPPNTNLRRYAEFDSDDNPPLLGELTLMFGQMAMCINPSAGYGAADRILWAVVGKNFRFTSDERVHGYQYGRCIEVDPDQLTVTVDWYASENDYSERNVNGQKTFPISEFRRFDVLFDKYIQDQCNLVQSTGA